MEKETVVVKINGWLVIEKVYYPGRVAYIVTDEDRKQWNKLWRLEDAIEFAKSLKNIEM